MVANDLRNMKRMIMDFYTERNIPKMLSKKAQKPP
jgi:hypothetical protein